MWGHGKNEIASSLYKLILNLNEQGKIKSKWLIHVKPLLSSNGFGNIWDNHTEINPKWFVKSHCSLISIFITGIRWLINHQLE